MVPSLVVAGNHYSPAIASAVGCPLPVLLTGVIDYSGKLSLAILLQRSETSRVRTVFVKLNALAAWFIPIVHAQGYSARTH